jgi:D-alanine-D-alanine ligase
MLKTKCALKETDLMTKDQKTKLGIIFGGKSGEHEVSLTSAASVINALDPDEFEITAIGITKTGKLANKSEIETMLPQAILSRASFSSVLQSHGAKMLVTSDTLDRTADSSDAPTIFFPLLHGPYGEDGTIQGLLEIAGLPYIGCGVLASAVGMDKDVTKRLLLQEGLPVTPYRTVFTCEIQHNLKQLQRSVEHEFGYPMFSKPANLGSSVGVVKIHTGNEFEEGIQYSAQFDRKILIEKGIDGRELECAILGNDTPQASVVGEVFSAHEFYDYEAKYLNPESRLEIPANIDNKKSEEIRDLALKTFKAIDGSGLARVDFFLERASGKVWINEINTMPGFTPISMYAKLWAASGIAFKELVRLLVQFGEERFKESTKHRISIS